MFFILTDRASHKPYPVIYAVANPVRGLLDRKISEEYLENSNESTQNKNKKQGKNDKKRKERKKKKKKKNSRANARKKGSIDTQGTHKEKIDAWHKYKGKHARNTKKGALDINKERVWYTATRYYSHPIPPTYLSQLHLHPKA